MSIPHERRHLVLEGAYNVRDLGGVPTAEGYTVRTGRLFRADALHNLTPADLEVLGIYGIASVVDLRSDAEITSFGVARLTEHGARHIHMSLLGDEPAIAEDRALQASLGEHYTAMANKWPWLFVRVVETLADVDNMPAVFHCAAGKDRTGMTAALIYSILGLDRNVIVADYVLTDANMDRILEMERRTARDRGEAPVEYPHSHSRAEAITISTFLDTLNERYGSPVAWLRHHGLPESAIETLRREMLA